MYAKMDFLLLILASAYVRLSKEPILDTYKAV